MKKIILIILLLTTTMINADQLPRFAKCLQWKQVCESKIYCLQSDVARGGCFRCVKPGRYGFHAYPQQVDRMTCNTDTVDYLRNMGYNCYGDNEPCLQAGKKKTCDWACGRYAS